MFMKKAFELPWRSMLYTQQGAEKDERDVIGPMTRVLM